MCRRPAAASRAARTPLPLRLQSEGRGVDARCLCCLHADAKHRVKQGKKAPLEALPGCVIFFVRTLEMLQGLCTRLQVTVPFMRPMAARARRVLLAHGAAQLKETGTGAGTGGGGAPPVRWHATRVSSASSLLHRLSRPTTSLQERVAHLMHALVETGELLGGQCCLLQDGRPIVDVAAGRMGMIDPRPVAPSSLFQLFQAGCPLLAALVLQHVERGETGLETPICKAWPAFGASGKQRLTVAELLRHTTGLQAAMPQRAHLRHLLDGRAMEAHVAAAAVDSPSADQPPPAAEYEGAPWGWAVCGLLRAFAGGNEATTEVAEWLKAGLLDPLGLDDELRIRVDDEISHRLARHSQSALMQELGMGFTDLTPSSMAPQPDGDGRVGGGDAPDSPPQRPAAAAGARASRAPHLLAPAPVDGQEVGEDAFAVTSAEVDWERFQGPQQLQLPSTYNASALRTAGLPGCAMFGSARALARFYSALGRGEIVSAPMLHQMCVSPVAGTLELEQASWGLGVQVGAATRTGRHDGRRAPVIGHRGTGGVVGLAIPSSGIAVAITVSKLSRERAPTRRLLELILEGSGYMLPRDADGGLQ